MLGMRVRESDLKGIGRMLMLLLVVLALKCPRSGVLQIPDQPRGDGFLGLPTDVQDFPEVHLGRGRCRCRVRRPDPEGVPLQPPELALPL